jgi:CRISPR-associated protein (TIGR03986 family)
LYVKAADWPQGIAGKPYQIVAKCNHEGHIVSKLLAIPQAAPIPPRLAGVARGTFLKTIPYCGSLLCQPDNKGYSHWIVESADQPETYDLPQEVRDEYQKKVIPSQHIKDHYAARYKNEYRHPPDLPLEEVCRQLELQKDDVVFFTHEHHEHHEHPVITTIGKSVNYLWPAKKSVFDLVKPYVTPENLGLSDSLSLAERLFGFSGKHRLAREEQNESHPFRGLVTVETAWGAVAQSYEEEAKWQELRPGEPIDENAVGFRVRLAPLTSPATHAKSRPLYLEPRTESRAMNGRSASYDDKEARFRGRKEYWHQNTADPARPIWEYHLFDAKWHEPVKTQCPPPLAVLNAVPSNTFHGRIQFKNLTDLELGALVQALEGDNENYCLKIGKGRPRGLGSIRVKIERVSLVNYEERYQTFGARAGIKEVSPEDLARWKQTFGKWQKEKDGEEAIAQATKNLGTFPGQASVRYYPLNFGQYSWLPNDQPGNTAGEPRPQDGRPPAMKKAADLKP